MTLVLSGFTLIEGEQPKPAAMSPKPSDMGGIATSSPSMVLGRGTIIGGMMGQDETAAPEEAAALDMLAALAAPQAENADTPEVFLANLSETLKASHGVDTDLAAALTDHLLTVTPHANAVANAKSAIVAIASKRAAPVGENANG
ncbi:hypothetical protein [Aurantimonas sp. A3-2-R12]|uniref:hypothetical protein n=1 Tax=Aurantimonas sp. A3-2-R12 TaxID=3114362 RepID=UPI002E17D5D1|nr:hypothetical protein [Aurantimonas sp. A3-2-R12]